MKKPALSPGNPHRCLVTHFPELGAAPGSKMCTVAPTLLVTCEGANVTFIGNLRAIADPATIEERDPLCSNVEAIHGDHQCKLLLHPAPKHLASCKELGIDLDGSAHARTFRDLVNARCD